jgi:hypothetical protein
MAFGADQILAPYLRFAGVETGGYPCEQCGQDNNNIPASQISNQEDFAASWVDLRIRLRIEPNFMKLKWLRRIHFSIENPSRIDLDRSIFKKLRHIIQDHCHLGPAGLRYGSKQDSVTSPRLCA